MLLRPNETVQALFTLTAPVDAAPSMVVEFDLRPPRKTTCRASDVKTIPVSASMVSIAEVALQQPHHGMEQAVNAGDCVVVSTPFGTTQLRRGYFLHASER